MKVLTEEEVAASMHDTCQAARQAREELVGEVANFDDEMASKVIEWESYDADPHSLQQALRRITLASGTPPGEGGAPRALVTLLGSALRAVGVRPLLDAVIDYLPAPDDRALPEARAFGTNFSGLVFKVTHDPNKGALCFVRVFSDELTEKQKTVYNVTRGKTERMTSLMA